LAGTPPACTRSHRRVPASEVRTRRPCPSQVQVCPGMYINATVLCSSLRLAAFDQRLVSKFAQECLSPINALTKSKTRDSFICLPQISLNDAHLKLFVPLPPHWILTFFTGLAPSTKMALCEVFFTQRAGNKGTFFLIEMFWCRFLFSRDLKLSL